MYACDPLPCPGEAEHGYSSPAAGSEKGPAVAIRSIGHGRFTVSRAHPPHGVPPGVTLDLRGFVPATGRTLRTFHAGRDATALEGDAPPRLDLDTVVLRPAPHELVALDLRSGARRRIAASARAWCRHELAYDLHGYYYNGRSGQYTGQSALLPCTADGRRSAAPGRVPSLVGAIGATAGGMTAWTDTGAVHAVPA